MRIALLAVLTVLLSAGAVPAQNTPGSIDLEYKPRTPPVRPVPTKKLEEDTAQAIREIDRRRSDETLRTAPTTPRRQPRAGRSGGSTGPGAMRRCATRNPPRCASRTSTPISPGASRLAGSATPCAASGASATPPVLGGSAAPREWARRRDTPRGGRGPRPRPGPGGGTARAPPRR